jgi:TonB family protein
VLEERIELIVEQKRRAGGVTLAIAVSLVLHTLVIIYLVRHWQSAAVQPAAATPMVRYVELMRQNPAFTEAPGPKRESAPINAPYSDANRKASMPEPTGDRPVTRPGDGGAIYTPPAAAGHRVAPAPAPQPEAAQPARNAAAPPSFREPVQANAGAVDWRNAIREVGKIASLGNGQQGLDLGAAGGGGEKGFAENGPISFETQWYDWGEYAQSMVSRIRVNWYGNMPDLIRTGMKGVVTIRFTIHRDGRISDVTILNSSAIPPYDFAAKKAIELSSPLNPLPKDFPNETERVTAMFYYNQEPPR